MHKFVFRHYYLVLLILFLFSAAIQAEELFLLSPVNTVADTAILPVRQSCAGVPWKGVVWIHVHDNEKTARQVAFQTLNEMQQGCLLDLWHSGKREIGISTNDAVYSFDPNRIFSAKGRLSTLKCHRGDCAVALAQLTHAAESFINQYLVNKQLIVALHNNHSGRGLSMRNYATDGSMAEIVQQIAVNPDNDPHDFFYVTTRRAFDFLAIRGFNVVLQNNEHISDDGSLSIWSVQQHIDYINVEAGSGHFAAQMTMLAAVWAYMQQYYSG